MLKNGQTYFKNLSKIDSIVLMHLFMTLNLFLP